MRLAGKRAFVTAAGQGIGRAIAEAFAREGADVTATDLDPALLEGLDATCFGLDVTDKDAGARLATAALEAFGRICAGVVHHGAVLDASDDEFDFAVTLNIRSQFHAIQAALPGMIERGAGSIINISSVASSVIAAQNRCVYGMSKAAVVGLTKSVALDYVTTGVRVNCICPGTVDSPSLQARLRAQGDYETTRAAFVARQPMGRIGKAEEIAALAL